jgi:hypothetical protein
LRVSANTGEGIRELIAKVVDRLVPVKPNSGEAVPYAPELAEQIAYRFQTQSS